MRWAQYLHHIPAWEDALDIVFAMFGIPCPF